VVVLPKDDVHRVLAKNALVLEATLTPLVVYELMELVGERWRVLVSWVNPVRVIELTP
jgi:hypothetical protein